MKYYLIFIASFILFSCQEEITLDLPQADSKLVVEGAIEPGFPPYVILTQNQGYFDEIDIDTYSNLFVDNVDTVKVWFYNEAGEKEIRFLSRIEGVDSLPTIYTDLSYDLSGNFPYYFSQEEKTYYLEIKWNNQIITAETTIPKSTPLDCLWVEQSETAEKDFKCDIRAIYSDPADTQNNIIIESKRIQHYTFNEDSCRIKNKADFPLQLIDAGSDVLINGESFETYFPKPKEDGFPTGAYNSMREEECSNGTILEIEGDVVLIKFSQIDEASMKFWRGLIRQRGTNGNPFSEPRNLVSNINGGLGVWTGYSPVYYIVPIIKNTTIYKEHAPKINDIF